MDAVAVCLFDPEALPEQRILELCDEEPSRQEVEKQFHVEEPPPKSTTAGQVRYQEGSSVIFFQDPAGVQIVEEGPLLVAVPWAVGPQRSRAEKPRLAHGAHGVHSALGCLAAVAAVGRGLRIPQRSFGLQRAVELLQNDLKVEDAEAQQMVKETFRSSQWPEMAKISTVAAASTSPGSCCGA
ncbi:unnamed protein product [Effrenium voratum]|nr:unnamed protein product [Effrenium voratum]